MLPPTGETLEPTQKPVIKQEPIPTPEPQNLPAETMIIKTAYGNISLTSNTTQEETPKIFGLSSQEIAVFVKPARVNNNVNIR